MKPTLRRVLRGVSLKKIDERFVGAHHARAGELRRARWLLLCASVLHCGASESEGKAGAVTPRAPVAAESSAEQPAAPPPSASAPASQPASGRLPTECAPRQADGVCAPPRAFVDQLCGSFPMPDLALQLLGPTSPFTRAYLNRNVEAWYTTGRSSTKAKLLLDEEVLVLQHAAASSTGMTVNGGGSGFDVLRWDGVCASVGAEEIAMRRPPNPRRADIPWQHLEKKTRERLLGDPDVAQADAARRKECKGTTALGMIPAACIKADERLSRLIAEAVLRGALAEHATILR